MKRYKVTLTDQEGEELHQLISKGKGAARKLLPARIVLKADPPMGGTDQQIREALEVSISTIERVRAAHPYQDRALL